MTSKFPPGNPDQSLHWDSDHSLTRLDGLINHTWLGDRLSFQFGRTRLLLGESIPPPNLRLSLEGKGYSVISNHRFWNETSLQVLFFFF